VQPFYIVTYNIIIYYNYNIFSNAFGLISQFFLIHIVIKFLDFGHHWCYVNNSIEIMKEKQRLLSFWHILMRIYNSLWVFGG